MASSFELSILRLLSRLYDEARSRLHELARSESSGPPTRRADPTPSASSAPASGEGSSRAGQSPYDQEPAKREPRSFVEIRSSMIWQLSQVKTASGASALREQICETDSFADVCKEDEDKLRELLSKFCSKFKARTFIEPSDLQYQAFKLKEQAEEENNEEKKLRKFVEGAE